MKSSDFKQILSTIQSKKSFLLLPHVNIDGDDLGSMLALGKALKKMGKSVYLYYADNIPPIYHFMPGLKEFKKQPPPVKMEVAVLMECSNLKRAGDGISLLETADLLINLDHHQDNSFYADLNWVEPESAALGEMIYRLIKSLKVPLDEEMALGLYLAILTDTGGFQYGYLTAQTHKIISELLAFPLKIDEISRKVYREKDFTRLKLFGKVAASLERSPDGKIAWAVLSRAMLAELNASLADTQNFVEDLNQIAGVEVLVLFKELEKGEVKASLRSSRLPVHKVAAHFGGGGHPQAAGCTLNGGMAKAQKELLFFLKKELKQL